MMTVGQEGNYWSVATFGSKIPALFCRILSAFEMKLFTQSLFS
jgi:hypothetical protein